MSITVNTNVSSINAQRHLAKSSKSLDTAMQRLSSGLRINSSADDAAGLAISTGITAQTNGLMQAERNANDGLSVVGTAEGALTTQTTILQRIRELAVQAANDINSADNRAAIQSEITAQVNELTRLGNTTTFNGLNLMDGTFANKQLQVGAYANQTIAMTLGDFRSTGMGAIATQSGNVAAVPATWSQLGAVGSAAVDTTIAQFTLNGATNYVVSSADGVSTVNATGSALAKANAINAMSATTGVTAAANAAKYLNTVAVAGGVATTAAESLNINGVEIFGANGAGTVIAANDATGTLVNRINLFTSRTGVTAALNGTSVQLTAADGRNIGLTVAGGTLAAKTGFTSGTYTGTITLNSTSDITIGGNAAGYTAMGFLNTTTMVSAVGNLTTVDVTSQVGAQQAILRIDSALKSVSTAESTLGALSNRLNNTISNIEIAHENLSAANSRIMDTDFATETANMTRAQIIQQSSVAVLTQANSRPQIALTLLKG